MVDEDFKLDDAKVWVAMFRSSKSLIIEMITEDSEALNLTELGLWEWFKARGLSTKGEPPKGESPI